MGAQHTRSKDALRLFLARQIERMYHFGLKTPHKRQKRGTKMDANQYTVYMARLEDLGCQIMDLVVEMRADPPEGWQPPSLGAAAAALGLVGCCADLGTMRGGD